MPRKSNKQSKGNIDNNTKRIRLRKFNLKSKSKSKNNNTVSDAATRKANKFKRKNRRKVIFRICLFTFIGFVIIGVGVVLGVLNDVISGTDSVKLEELQLLKLTTFIYDNKGNEIGNLHSGENRVIVAYENLPKSVIDAVVAIEDERFFNHGGVDLKRTGAAVFTYVINGGNSSFGGSTITQQLIKNVTNDKGKSWQRKIREWYRAITLESKLEKENILESYLNTIYMGEGAYGIEVASQTYFSKSATEVNLAEAACLAAIIQTPEGTNPYNGDKQKEKLLARQKVVLNKLIELEKITQEEYDEAIKYKIEFKKSSIANSGKIQTYFVDAVLEAVIADLMETKNITRQVAVNMIYSNGYKIHSTMDANIQKAINNTYNNNKLFYADKAGDFMQSAMVVMDHKKGYVLGLIGGADEKKGAFEYNRATMAKRQPGSTFKLIGSYGPAFELGASYPGMGIDDSPISINGWNPRNYYGYYNGYVTTRSAIALSMNIPAVKTLQKIDLDYAFQFAKNMGITTLISKDKNLASLALGGLTYGATVMDMATAYSTIANGGIYIKPKLYTKVLDSKDNEILITSTEYKRVMKETTAYLLTDCLKSVVTSGTGTSAKISNSIESAGKTGNTNDDYDQWFVGFSPYYTTAAWNGYDKNKSIGTRKTGSYPYTATKVYTSVMKEIHKGLAAAKFTKPKGIVSAQICTVSGLVATDACKADTRKGIVKTEIFASGTVPTKICDIHKLVQVCSVSKLLPTEFCSQHVDLIDISVITRGRTSSVKSRDWAHMLPTDKCKIHVAAPVVEPPPVEEPEPTEPPEGEIDPGDDSGQGGGNVYNEN